MPAIPIIVDVVLTKTFAAGMVSYLAPIFESTLVAEAATGAIIGAAGGAVGAAAQNQDIGKGALRGAEGGAVGGLVTGALGGTSAVPAGEYKGWQLPKGMQVDVTQAGQKAFAGGAGAAAGALATGATPEQALQSGLISAGSQYVAGKVIPGKGTSADIQRGLLAGETSSALQKALAPPQQQPAEPASGLSVAPITGQAQQASPGSAALAQALRVGDAGGPIFGATGDEKGKRPGKWNIESLKYMGSEA